MGSFGRVSAVLPSGRVHSLTLQGDEVTDDWILRVNAFSSLRGLELYRTGVTEAGLFALTNLAQLESLTLDGAQVSDRTLLRLSRLRALRELNLWYAVNVSDAAIARFRESRPDVALHVHRPEPEPQKPDSQ